MKKELKNYKFALTVRCEINFFLQPAFVTGKSLKHWTDLNGFSVTGRKISYNRTVTKLAFANLTIFSILYKKSKTIKFECLTLLHAFIFNMFGKRYCRIVIRFYEYIGLSFSVSSWKIPPRIAWNSATHIMYIHTYIHTYI